MLRTLLGKPSEKEKARLLEDMKLNPDHNFEFLNARLVFRRLAKEGLERDAALKNLKITPMPPALKEEMRKTVRAERIKRGLD